MERRSFIFCLLPFAVIPMIWRPKKVTLQATVSPTTEAVPLLFAFGNQLQTALTDANGVASVVFRYRSAEASVSGSIDGVYVSDAVLVSC